MFTSKTALNGRFSVPDFDFSGSTQIVFNAIDIKDRPIDVKVTLDEIKTELPQSQFESAVSVEETKNTETYVDISNTRRRFESLYDFENVTKLDEVVVTEKNKEKNRNQTPSTYGQTPDATLYTSEHPAIQTVLQLIGLFAGVSVNGNTVSIRNRGTPLWVLDGIPVYNDNPSALTRAREAQRAARNSDNPNPQLVYRIDQAVAPVPVPTFIETMDTFTIERVEILRGASAAIYGSRGGNGVILLYTKKGEGTPPIISPDFTISGHSETREFYAPKYDVKLERHKAPDYRATLYWNPSIFTDINGNATIEFFNSDVAEQIQVELEGLSQDGRPGVFLQTFGETE